MNQRRVRMGVLLKKQDHYLAAHPETGERDIEIAKRYAKGESSVIIAMDMFISKDTVYRAIRKVEDYLKPQTDHFDRLRQYAENNLPNYGDGGAHSILEMLFCHYEEYNRFETEAITEGFHKLYDQMEGKKLDEIDPVIYTTSILCREHEKAGFVEGVKVGVLMGVELYS